MLYFCKPIVQRNNHKIEKNVDPPFCNAKSQTSVLLRLFAHANGRKKPRMSFFAMQKASPMVLSTFSQ